ncbi:MAG TPA: beta-ketoacyl-[acyl-carrier-protein] synthase family protein, partial [Kiritimatiellia bacterium]|nr:beta-ketoacyl-[acyl-carrier-protein] synthase family protein [Kiritimatiellia bacterium]HMP00797.1 beta-ketoacyl-[acyl-carrier-protein] synthase family protein [Kiritimatiellia bacterium]HMP91210.1 beta-ketoacyl-[acyl-carrier-protein] synthase family protein [Kiritimatiellia bacterium]
VAANGIGLPAFWDSLVRGHHGLGPITLFDASRHPIQVAGEVKNFKLSDYVNGSIKPKRLARHTQFAVAAVRMALDQAGIPGRQLPPKTEAALYFGVSTSAVEIIQRCHVDVMERGALGVHPFLLAASQPNDPATVLGDYFGISRRMTFSTACAAGMDALTQGARLIREGVVDMVVAGGADAPINELTLASFSAAGILPYALEGGEHINRPFDADRKGGLFAEGSAALVMERLDHALARGAQPIAEIKSSGCRCDASVQQSFEGLPGAIDDALANAGIPDAHIQYINAHGPGHPLLDIFESKAIRDVFGAKAVTIPLSSIKGNLGNPLAAAGVLQVIASTYALYQGVVPPTANLVNVDPECGPLGHVYGTARIGVLDNALVNSHGMGGSNTCMVLGRAPQA